MTTETTVSTALDQQLHEAIAWHGAGQLAEAEQGYRVILQSQPEHTQANYNLGVLLLQQGQAKAARPFFAAALQSSPEREQCWLACIEVLMQCGDLIAARSLLDQVSCQFFQSEDLSGMRDRLVSFEQEASSCGELTVRDSESDTQGSELLMELCAQGEYAKAEGLARSLIRRFPECSFFWKALGVALLELGRSQEALEPMQHAVQFRPDDGEAHFNLGNLYKELGLLDEAEKSYRAAIKFSPYLEGPYLNLGAVFFDKGALDDAEIYYGKALRINPESAEANNLLGALLGERGREIEAELCYLRALAFRPGYAKALANLGLCLDEQGRVSEAEKIFSDLIAMHPGFLNGYVGMARLLKRQERFSDAIVYLYRGLEIDPEDVVSLKLLAFCLLSAGNARAAVDVYRKVIESQGGGGRGFGVLMREKGLHDDAEGYFREQIERYPDEAPAYYELGVVLLGGWRFKEAEGYFRKALELEPGSADFCVGLGVCLARQHRPFEAEKLYRVALKIEPNHVSALSNLGAALKELGRQKEGIGIMQKIADEGDELWVHSNLLFSMAHSDEVSPADLFLAHREFGCKLESVIHAAQYHDNDRDPARKLKIGFVSGDLGNHPVALFVGPVLRLMNKDDFDIYAYSQLEHEDSNSAVLKRYVKGWCRISGLSDSSVFSKIQEDGIDILFDLSGHTAGNRLSVFAMKPAPVQVSWIGYPATTGIRAVDYYLADRFCAPPGDLDDQFVEKLVRLPVAWAFQSAEKVDVGVGSPPALKTGVFTFGSFNRVNKLSPRSIALWCSILNNVPCSRMLIAGVEEDYVRNSLASRFMEFGIDPGRLVFYPRLPFEEYLKLHNEVDLLLDTVPYGGGTTTNHALWMGVPTLTLFGETLPGRQGAALMNHVGLSEFVAGSEDEYVRKAISWTQNIPDLTVVRAGMRMRLLSSELRSPERVAKGVEAALREMWGRWCRGEAPASFEVQ